MLFTCPVCDSVNVVEEDGMSIFERETPSCSSCGSSTRQRSLVKAILDEFSPLEQTSQNGLRDIVGIGISDWEGLETKLQRDFKYVNTYYHTSPYLDVTSLEVFQEGVADFVICSDVLEHIVPPVENGFNGLFQLLKPGGFLVFSIPYDTRGKSKEHYPNLHKFRIVEIEGTYTLVNKSKSGTYEFFEDLVFHGGPGTTLEMRRMAIKDVHACLLKSGFVDVQQVGTFKESGIIWLHDEGRTLTARKPL
jgi:hypothetical protein